MNRARVIAVCTGFSGYVRSQGLNLPIKIVETDGRLQLTVSYKGHAFDLFDALELFQCTGATSRLASRLAGCIDSPDLQAGDYTLQMLQAKFDL
jgi:hypothetical protein